VVNRPSWSESDLPRQVLVEKEALQATCCTVK
jgi:hypothetical protein